MSFSRHASWHWWLIRLGFRKFPAWCMGGQQGSWRSLHPSVFLLSTVVLPLSKALNLKLLQSVATWSCSWSYEGINDYLLPANVTQFNCPHKAQMWQHPRFETMLMSLVSCRLYKVSALIRFFIKIIDRWSELSNNSDYLITMDQSRSGIY